MDTMGTTLLQFGLGGGALAVLAFFGWMQFKFMAKESKACSARWEDMAKTVHAQNETLKELVRQCTDQLRESNRLVAVALDRRIGGERGPA